MRRFATGLFAAVACAFVAAPAAQAAFPGANGRISYTSNRDGNGNLFSIFPDGTAFQRLTTDTADDAQSGVVTGRLAHHRSGRAAPATTRST